MVGRHLLIAGVPLVIATAYRLYTGSNDDLRGRDRVGVTEPVRRNNNNKKYGGKRNNRGPRASQDEVEDYDQNPYEEIALDSTVRRNCSKCKVVERKLNSYIRDTILKKNSCIECQDLSDVKNKLYSCLNKDITGYLSVCHAMSGDIFQPGQTHAKIIISEDMKGFSYAKLFSNFFNDRKLTRVEIDDPYIRKKYQFGNFIKFCETVIKADNSVFYIKLTTKGDSIDKVVATHLKTVADQLKNTYNIILDINPVKELETKEIRLNNGFTIRMGRGLDYFKPLKPYQLGFYDMDLRPCIEHSIELIRKL